MIRKAKFDNYVVRTYRYYLYREWDASKPILTFVLLNPSTADDKDEDPTVKNCIKFADEWGYGRFHLVNLFAYISEDPSKLREVEDPIGPKNDEWLIRVLKKTKTAVVAWGAEGPYMCRNCSVMPLLAAIPNVFCMGLTSSGQPWHPARKEGIPELQEFVLPKLLG